MARKNPRRVEIPKWAMKHLLRWAEKAYRRGYQHGILAGENGMEHDSAWVIDFRFEHPIKNSRFAVVHKNEMPAKKWGGIQMPLEDRHIECDGMRGCYVTEHEKSYIIQEL